jgi:hypothetical protein
LSALQRSADPLAAIALSLFAVVPVALESHERFRQLAHSKEFDMKRACALLSFFVLSQTALSQWVLQPKATTADLIQVRFID